MDIVALKGAYKEIGVLIPQAKYSIFNSSKGEVVTTSHPSIKNWNNLIDVENNLFTTKRFCLHPHKNLIVIDVDMKNNHDGIQSFKNILGLDEHIPTLTQTTKSGGKHYWFKVSDDCNLKNWANVADGIDIRIHGAGNVAVYPTQGYEWLDWEVDAEPVPEILWLPRQALNVLLSKGDKQATDYSNVLSTNKNKISEGGRHHFLVHVAAKYQDLDSDMLYSILESHNKKHCDPRYGSYNKKGDNIELSTMSKDYANYKHSNDMDIYENQLIANRIAENLFLFEKKEELNILNDTLDNIYPRKGILKTMLDYFVDSTMSPQKLLYYGNAIALLGVIMGQKYSIDTNLRFNTYIMGVAGASEGKDNSRNKTVSVMDSISRSDLIGNPSYTSPSAILSMLREQPASLSLMDEMGLELQKMSGRNVNPNYAGIKKVMLELFTNASSSQGGTGYTNRQENTGDRIMNPIFSIYATTTMSTLQPALSSNDALSGLIPRFILLIGEENTYNEDLVPDFSLATQVGYEVKEALDFMPLGGDLGQINHLTPPKPYDIPFSPGVLKLYNKRRGSLLLEAGRCDIKRTIYGRVIENAKKLGGILAFSENYKNPVVNKEIYEVSIKIALYSANQWLLMIDEHLSDTSHQSNLNRLAADIKGFGADGVTLTNLGRATRWIETKTRNNILSQLIEAGVVVKTNEINLKNNKFISKFKYQPKKKV